MTDARKLLPPYLSYRTFRSFLDSLAVAGVPTRIDRSLLLSKPRTTQTLLLNALRYLGLTSEEGVSAPELKRLVETEGSERRDLWREILAGAYPSLFNSKIDLARTTTDEVAEVFKKEGVSSPDTIRKCLTFFSLAARDAGIMLSRYVRVYAGRRRARQLRLGVGFEQKLQETDVFISYSTKDKPAADFVCSSLEAKGFRCWIAHRDILPGRDWGESIIQAITHSRLMVLIFSSHADKSPQIKREVERAVNKNVPILTFFIQKVPLAGSFEYYLSTVQWLDASTPPLQRHLNQLEKCVKSLLEHNT